MSDAKEVLTVSEAAEYLRIGQRTAYKMAHNGELPVVHLGTRMVVPRWALEEYLRDKLSTTPTTNPTTNAGLLGVTLGARR